MERKSKKSDQSTPAIFYNKSGDNRSLKSTTVLASGRKEGENKSGKGPYPTFRGLFPINLTEGARRNRIYSWNNIRKPPTTFGEDLFA